MVGCGYAGVYACPKLNEAPNTDYLEGLAKSCTAAIA